MTVDNSPTPDTSPASFPIDIDARLKIG